MIDDARDLDHALQVARSSHAATYRPIQQRLFDYTFDRSGETAAVRGARVLDELVTGSATERLLPPIRVPLAA